MRESGRQERGSPESLSGAFRATGMGLSGFTPKEGEGRSRAVEGKECPEDTWWIPGTGRTWCSAVIPAGHKLSSKGYLGRPGPWNKAQKLDEAHHWLPASVVSGRMLLGYMMLTRNRLPAVLQNLSSFSFIPMILLPSHAVGPPKPQTPWMPPQVASQTLSCLPCGMR